MTGMGRFVLFIYNLIILALAVIIVGATLGWLDPQAYLNVILSSPNNKIIAGIIAIIVGFVAVLMLIWAIKPAPGIDTVTVSQGTDGEISMSIAAVKAIIMRAIRQVEGIKELRPDVHPSPAGVKVKLHTMILPDTNVPEISALLQSVVRDNLEKVGGLQVAEIKVLIDDFTAAGK